MKKYQEALLIARNLFDMVDIYNKEQKRDFLKVEKNIYNFSNDIKRIITSNNISEFVLTSGTSSESLTINYKGLKYSLIVLFKDQTKEIENNILITRLYNDGSMYDGEYMGTIKINEFLRLLKEFRDNYIKMFTDKELIKKYPNLDIK